MQKYKKSFMIGIFLSLVQVLFYGINRLIQGPTHLIGSTYDSYIPYIKAFIMPYVLWYILLILVPIIIYKKSKDEIIKYSLTYILIIFIANIVFYIYPTAVVRPDAVYSKNIIDLLIYIVYTVDTPVVNCCPSLHCAMSTLYIIYLNKLDINKVSKYSLMILSIIIIPSTLFIKQHVIIDAITGIMLAIVSYLIINKLNINTSKIINNLKL